MQKTLDHIRNIKKQYEKEWLSYPEVVGVGIGQLSDGQTGIIISLKKLDAKVKQKFPGSVQGVNLGFELTGEIKAL